MFNKIRSLFKPKDITYSYVCPCCGLDQRDWPAIAYGEPVYYSMLSEDDKNNIAELTSDFCIIRYPDTTNYFIRCVLLQDVVGNTQQLDYGIWVSLSEKSFNDYKQHFDENDRDGGYFGWISNNLLGYDDTTSIPADVHLGKNGNRPEVVPHSDFDHAFVRDYYSGITQQEAHARIKKLLDSNKK